MLIAVVLLLLLFPTGLLTNLSTHSSPACSSPSGSSLSSQCLQCLIIAACSA